MKLLDRVASALSTAKAGLDLIRSDDAPTVVINNLRQHLLTLQEELLDTREMAQALNKELLDLRQQLADTERFDAERERYVLTSLGPGAVAYIFKEEVGAPEQPPIYFCAHCFEHRQRSILQFAVRNFHHDTYTCNTCDAQVLVPNDQKMEVLTIPRGRGRFDDF